MFVVGALLAALTVVLAPSGQAKAAGLDGVWSCSIPAGYTWDSTQTSYSCNTLGNKIYHVRIPADGLWACSIPAGYTWDSAQTSYSCNNLENKIYHLRG
jgi:hypothetical protein